MDRVFPGETAVKQTYKPVSSFLGQVDTEEEANRVVRELRENFPECLFRASRRKHWGDLSHLPDFFNIMVSSEGMDETLFQRIGFFADEALHKAVR